MIDALGAPIDGKGEIKEADYYPVESEAPGVCERKSVSVPLQTGILAIDSMFPIGRGQREPDNRRPPDGKDRDSYRHYTEPKGSGYDMYIRCDRSEGFYRS